jgi:putative membrane protein
MIIYNPKDWFTFIFKMHKADTFQKLKYMLVIIFLYSLFIAFLEKEVFHVKENSLIRNVSLVHTLLGFVLSLLLVFRTNTAYDRWWEGRKLWGTLTNNCRNLALKLDSIFDNNDHDNRNFFSNNISNFTYALSYHLLSEKTRMMLSEEVDEEIHVILKEAHPPIHVAQLIMNKAYELNKLGKINNDQMWLINEELKVFMDVSGACERIKNTPIPFSYSLFIKKFIFFYIITLPMGYVFSIGYWVAPLVMFAFYVLVSLEVIAEEIEDPFNMDNNDIPTSKLARNISRNVKDILAS